MIATSTIEAGDRFGPPGSVFHRLLVSRRLQTIALLCLAVVGVGIGIILTAVLLGDQRNSSDWACGLRAQLLAAHVNNTITFLGAVNGLVNAGGYVSDSGSYRLSPPTGLTQLALPGSLLCLDVAVEVRNRTGFEKGRALRIVTTPASDAVVLYPVLMSTCAGRVLGVDLALGAGTVNRSRVTFRGESEWAQPRPVLLTNDHPSGSGEDASRLDSVVVPDRDHVLVGYLALGTVQDLSDFTVRNSLGRVLFTGRSTSGASALATSTTVGLGDAGLWTVICWSNGSSVVIPYLLGASVACLITSLVFALSYGLRQARDHQQRYLHGNAVATRPSSWSSNATWFRQ